MVSSLGHDLQTRSEAELLCLAQEGSAAAFGVLAQRYRPMLMAALLRRRLAMADAEDVVQDAFTRAYTSISSFDLAKPFGPWITTIAWHVVATHHRKLREQPTESIDPPDRSAYPAEAIAAGQERQYLWDAARSILSARQFDALYLRYAQQMSVRDAAAAMKISTLHMKVILFRARKRLLNSDAFRRAFGDTPDHACKGELS